MNVQRNENTVLEVYVLGCQHGPGHYLWTADGLSKAWRPLGGPIWTQLDCAPRGVPKQDEGEVAVSLCAPAPGWSFVSWWDRSVDSRGGSHTGILARGEWTAPELVALGKLHAPWAFRVELGGWSLPPPPAKQPGTVEQPAPIPNDLPAVWDLVIADMQARDALGLKRYGTRLQPHNGRDALLDAYQEAQDLVVYLRQEMYERRVFADLVRQLLDRVDHLPRRIGGDEHGELRSLAELVRQALSERDGR